MSQRQLRNARGTTGIQLIVNQKVAMLLVFNNDHNLCDMMINVIKTSTVVIKTEEGSVVLVTLFGQYGRK